MFSFSLFSPWIAESVFLLAVSLDSAVTVQNVLINPGLVWFNASGNPKAAPRKPRSVFSSRLQDALQKSKRSIRIP